MTEPRIQSLRFSPASREDVSAGLLGFLTFTFGDLVVVDGVTLRRTAAGRLTLSWPSRKDGRGARHFVVRPLSDVARERIEREILMQLPMLPGN